MPNSDEVFEPFGDWVSVAGNSWRQQLKSGPLRAVYGRLRWVKRRIRNEPIGGYVRVPAAPMNLDGLRQAIATMPDQSRLYYSLGLAYLDNDDAQLLQALACLRSAETLAFEAPERVALYKAVVAAKRGKCYEARNLVDPLVPYELTVEEDALRRRLLETGAWAPPPPLTTPDIWGSTRRALEDRFSDAKSLLVMGDVSAATADWLPDARYLLAAVEVTGLTPAAVATLELTFDVGVGPLPLRRLSEEAGLRCTHWLSVDSVPDVNLDSLEKS